MSERPILFSAPMVRALLAGTKTVTRRLFKPRHDYFIEDRRPFFEPYVYAVPESVPVPCPYGEAGDRLWVKETHAFKCLDPLEYLYGPLKSLGLRKYGGGEPEPGCNLRVRSTDAMVVYLAHPTSYMDLPNWPGYSTYRSDTPTKWRPSIFMPRWASRLTLDVVSVRVERLHEITEEDAAREGVEPLLGEYRLGFEEIWKDINGLESWRANPLVWRVEFKS